MNGFIESERPYGSGPSQEPGGGKQSQVPEQTNDKETIEVQNQCR